MSSTNGMPAAATPRSVQRDPESQAVIASASEAIHPSSFRDAPLGAGPESILTIVVMDSGLAASRRPGMTRRHGLLRNDGRSIQASTSMRHLRNQSSRQLVRRRSKPSGLPCHPLHLRARMSQEAPSFSFRSTEAGTDPAAEAATRSTFESPQQQGEHV